MPPKYSYAVLGASVCVLGSALAYLGGMNGLLESIPLLLFLVSPIFVFSLAALVAKRNVIVRLAVVLGCIFLTIDVIALLAGVDAKASTSVIGLGVLIILQLLVAVPVLIASLIAGRVRWGRESNGIV